MITRNPKFATRPTFYGLPAVVICLALFILGVTMGALDAAKAQTRVRTYSQSEVARLIRDVEQSSQDFQRDFDRWLNRNPLNDQQREDRYSRQVEDLTNDLSSLRSNFDSGNDWWLVRRDVQRSLNTATSVNSAL